MAHHIDDRWLWLGLGATLFLAIKIMRASIQDTIRLTQIRTYESNEDEGGEERMAQDTLPLGTLQTLFNSPNHNISHIATELILQQFHGSEDSHKIHQQIKRDAESDNEDLQRRARITLEYLSHGVEPKYRFSRSEADGIFSRQSMYDNDDGDLESLHDASYYVERSLAEVIVPSARAPVAGWTAVPRERPALGDAEVRRRRREAVVLHEGAGRIEESDIIRPQGLA